MATRAQWVAWGLGLTVAMAAGCSCGRSGGGGEGDDPGTRDFVVDNPLAEEGGRGDESDGGFVGGFSETGGFDGAGGFGTGGVAGTDGFDEGEGEGEGEREITEADIVSIQGDRLYALSNVGGLSVVDISAPDERLPVLGRYRINAEAFEMYVDGDQVFAITNDNVVYEQDEQTGAQTWHETSRLLALDASDPDDITLRGDFELPGRIQDSRRVGDVLYLVTFEDGSCWSCPEQQPRTVVTSLDVSDPARVEAVDQLVFANQTDDPWDFGGPRSVSATDERMYLGGIEFDSWSDLRSEIDVVDISDPGGMLLPGVTLEVEGAIESRWQMDEHDGVLRVLSQRRFTGEPPVLETFSVASATDVVPLGSLALSLPQPETLQAVRFDGLRAYAITFRQVDPLFTLDLSDPEAPQQVGELEIPGWIFHLEPRGDRLLGLGYEPGHPDGPLNVSLFDIEDLANPALLVRVRFGPDWASFAEERNQIHKAFTILDELDLLLVPYAGQEYGPGTCSEYRSGTQLIDWTGDALSKRGVAPSRGRSRRAYVHRDRLLTFSDQAIQAFDIDDRDAPALRSEVALAVTVRDVAVEGDAVVRVTSDQWSGQTALEVVASATAEDAQPLGRVMIPELTEDSLCRASQPIELLVKDGYAYLVRQLDAYSIEDRRLALDTIDVREPSAPTWVGSIDLPFSLGSGPYAKLGDHGLLHPVVLHHDALVFARNRWVFEQGKYVGTYGHLEVVDLTVPGAPRHVSTLLRPRALDLGTLQVLDDTLVSWQMRPVDDDPSKVRFYLDRFDVSSPATPTMLPSINVPGQVVTYDANRARAVVVGFELETSRTGCWTHPRYWMHDDLRCVLAHRPLHLMKLGTEWAELLDSLDVEGELGRLRTAVASTDRLFAMVRQGDDPDDPDDPLPWHQLAVVTGQGSGSLRQTSRVQLSPGGLPVALVGTTHQHALFTGDRTLGFVDASDADHPTVTVSPTLGSGCPRPTVQGDTVYCPMSEYGLQAFPIP